MKNKSRFGIVSTNSTVERTKTTENEDLDPSCKAEVSAQKHKKRKSGTDRLPNNERFVGINTNLEKDYLRLTTYPRKEDVRPYEILVKSLAHIKKKYIQDEDFEWVNNQLKSVRQDIVCQGIRNKFVLDVYETHARILLENGDLNEFNQCQTMICTLTEGFRFESDKTATAYEFDQFSYEQQQSLLHNTKLNSPISTDCKQQNLLQQSREARLEFRSYALLYALVRNSRIELKRELDRMNDILLEERKNCRRDSCCEHALQALQAVEEYNYHAFFRLYASAPHMSAYLMDFLVKRVRDHAYQRILASYRPNVSIENVRAWLLLDDLEETRTFLEKKNACFIQVLGEDPFWIDCKTSNRRE